MKTNFFLIAILFFLYAFQNALFAQLTADAGPDQTICTGVMTATLGGSPTASGGTAPYTYSWTPATDLSSSTVANPIAFPTITTTYTLQVTDAAFSTATDNVTITVTPPPIANAGTDVTICAGSSVALTASGGLTYLWSPGGFTTPSITVSPATTTTYTVTVTGAGGCTASDDVTVIVNGFINVSASSTNESCTLCDGSATLTATGGTPPYTYIWSTGAMGPTITGLCAGTYSVTVTDATGCSASSAATIMGSLGVAVVLDTLINANCDNNSLGSIAVHTECGTPPYSYLWSTSSTDSVITNLVQGQYTVTAVDALSDTATATFPVSNTPNIYASITTTFANCGNNGTATVNALGTYPPFTYEWSDPLHQTAVTAINLSPGSYNVTVTDLLECSIIGSTYINSNCMSVIKGRVYLDTNQNCIQDIGEPSIPNKMLYVSPGYYYGSTDSDGDYTIMTANLNNTLHAPYMQAPYAIVCPSAGTYSLNFSQQGDTLSGKDFTYFADPDYFDLSVNMTGQNARPGFTKTNWIYYYNNSLLPQDVIVRLTYDSLLQYDSCHQGGVHFPSQHKIEWTINNVPPNNYYWGTPLEAYFYTPPTLNLGTMLFSCCEIFPATGDANPANNTYCRNEIVTGSQDPNSKNVSPAGYTEDGFITANDSVLDYTIHFQNTGTDTAFTVVVIDTLSPYLDPATVMPGAASHPYTFDLSGQGILAFRFDNILLPDSNVNEPASNGYVSFTVKQKNSNQDGTIIENTAANYFDFNLPVNTNTVINTLDFNLYIYDIFSEENQVTFYPNPFFNTFNVKLNESPNYPCTLKIINNLSAVEIIKEITQSVTSVSGLTLRNGIYYVNVEDKNGRIIGKGKIISNR